MKKAIKNYLAKLHDNKKKGFSLVELIIVIAIMAILVGVVASQVIPYMEKSRQAKDQQQLSSICTDLVSSIAQTSADVGEVGDIDKKELSSLVVAGDDSSKTKQTALEKNFAEIRGKDKIADAYSAVQGKLKSKAATDKGGKHIYVEYKSSTGVVIVYMTETGASSGAKVAKLTAESE